jgi:hypothetical protein
MSSQGSKNYRTYYGNGDVRASRYVVLYVAQVGWLVLGIYLFRTAHWQSSCTPTNLWDVYPCALQLPDSGNWPEAALFTWLFATPILLLLEVSRRMGKDKD